MGDSTIRSIMQPGSNIRRITIDNVAQDIEQELLQSQNFLFHENSSLPRVKSFAVDLALVGLSIRTGHLVDALCPKDPCRVFSTLLHRLEQKSKLFQDVFHVYEPYSEQSFLINASLLLAKYTIEDMSNWPHTSAYPVFVSTGSPPKILSTPTEGLFALVQNLIQQLRDPSPVLKEKSTIILPQGLFANLTVPFAAVLLEYPVAYCPSGTVVSPFLSSATLDIYEVRLTLPDQGYVTSGRRKAWPSVNDEDRHYCSVLKFSCPSDLGRSCPGLNPQSIQESLQSCFDSRIANLLQLMGSTHTISVHHTIESLDRVAL
ncbi:hypothetical protein C8J55DRAFT_280224 [Lentinula edodes]|uniref:Uncharacterized protein n=1 Tax=Lentinula lateritia TaxID=40482 RepID=A0A9W9AXJ9_9AGAR|nr:hypothetical protein C8J55DRAFT_280224 [Lentinula edodes]